MTFWKSRSHTLNNNKPQDNMFWQNRAIKLTNWGNYMIYMKIKSEWISGFAFSSDFSETHSVPDRVFFVTFALAFILIIQYTGCLVCPVPHGVPPFVFVTTYHLSSFCFLFSYLKWSVDKNRRTIQAFPYITYAKKFINYINESWILYFFLRQKTFF